ncbi:uncharacterized protein H6S33_007945 [Morchella sextelata]|uniref:uncharacterized protein n=1 Tax=Morchella sextelata TaxID=1174677 RepID=UPI001D057CA9|nr:uncharacterized protein H6S33_007945 [Morchella sextelata]KAH0602941.1 hypothetical protein H6S33_007945 [Morchella sextelata]
MLKFTWPLGQHLDAYAAHEADAAPFEMQERVQMVAMIEGMWMSVVERFAFYGLVGEEVRGEDVVYWAEVRAFYGELGKRVGEVVNGE